MKYIAEGGTDGGSMLLFDPEALPDDYDEQSKIDPTEILEQATLNGDAYWINTDGSDGDWLLHAFVDESVTPELRDFLRDEEQVDAFRVPSGKLYYAGVEYGFRHDDSFLKKYPGMGGLMEMKAGVYELSLYRAEYPEGFMEEKLRGQVSGFAYWLHQSMGLFVMLGLVGVVVMLLSIFKLGMLPVLIPIGLVLLALPFVAFKSSVFKKTDKNWMEIQRDYPSVVAVMKTKELTE